MPNMIAYGKEIVSGGRSGSGTTTSWNQIQTTGTKIAEIGIDGIKTNVYAPTGGSGGSSTTWDQIQDTGTKIAEIGIDGVTTDVYAPSGTTYTAGDGIDITNDEISVDEMPDTDMSEIVSPLPSTMSRRMKYSTEEQIVGEWIDGRPIYQKTIDIGALPDNSEKQVNHNISNLDFVVDIKGCAKSSSSGNNIHLPHPAFIVDNIQNLVQVVANNTVIKISSGSNVTPYSGYITLQYTKTTD